jgi:hypothetical protein
MLSARSTKPPERRRIGEHLKRLPDLSQLQVYKPKNVYKSRGVAHIFSGEAEELTVA